jgi:enolase-phosphatase E1
LARFEVAPRAILLDIEGTTTPIDFVKDTLFPYARERGREFILNHLEDNEIQMAIRQLQADNVSDRAAGGPAIQGDSSDAIEQTIDYYLWLIDEDRKSTGLKTIQGRIWEEGYARGELQSSVFPDVLPALERWHQQRRVTAIYSSGSVLAQQLLFRHTIQGDLTPLIGAYFDTRVGNKKQADSYTKIAGNLALSTSEVLFVSDVVSELDAALEAGMMAALCVRPGNTPLQPYETGYLIIHSFEQLPC